jgi:hypothetical protein
MQGPAVPPIVPVANVDVSLRASALQDAQDELLPSRTFERVNDNAKFLAGSLSVVGTLVTAAGLLSIDRLRVNPLAFVMATAAVILATLAVLTAIACMVLREREVHPGNLDEVESWYNFELGSRARALAAAGWALFAAILIGSFAAGLVVFASPSTPALSLQFIGHGPNAKLSEKVGVQGLAPGSRVETSITGYDASSQPVVLGTSVTTADSTGKVDFSADIAQPGIYVRYVLSVVVDGNRTPFTLELRLGSGE